jgi:PDZ domain-containing protein
VKRRSLLLAALIALTLGPFVLIALFVELPILVLEPGPAPDVARRSKIGAHTFPSEGSIHLTTARVNSPSGSTAVEIVEGLVDGDKHVLPREAVYPAGRSEQETKGVQAAQMSQSESAAATAALNALGMPSIEDGVFVNEVVTGVPAARRIEAGDVIVAVGGSPVTTVSQLGSALEKRRPGDEVELEVRRGGDTKKVTVRTVESGDEEGKAEIGVKVSQSHRSPIEIAIDAEDIGGPSAGLMFALSIYDRLTPEDLTGGRKIAGTGTIENSGRSARIGEVGAVDLKIKAARKIGADVFVVPRGELREAQAAAAPNMTVIGVSTFSEAISQLRRLAEAPAERP